MSKLLNTMLIIFVTAALAACDKAPNGIIPESRLDDLEVDLFKAEAFIEDNPSQFESDSMKSLLKQSVLAKHGYTQDDYDRSLGWYAKNMDTYAKVHQSAVRMLTDERKKLEDKRVTNERGQILNSNNPNTGTAHHYYPQNGDSADVWTDSRSFVITPNYHNGYITFNIPAGHESKPGDRYELTLKRDAGQHKLQLTIITNYRDGASSLMSRNSTYDGWETLAIQTDSTRDLKNITGFIAYNPAPRTVTFIDSVMIVRTRLDRNKYPMFTVQRFFDSQINKPKQRR